MTSSMERGMGAAGGSVAERRNMEATGKELDLHSLVASRSDATPYGDATP